MVPFPVDIEQFEGDLRVVAGGVELHESEGAGFVVAPDQSVGFDHGVGVAVAPPPTPAQIGLEKQG